MTDTDIESISDEIKLPFPAWGETSKTTERRASGWNYVGWISRGPAFEEFVGDARQDDEGKRDADVYAEGAICWWKPAPPLWGETPKTIERRASGWKYVGWISRTAPTFRGFDKLVEGAKQPNNGLRDVDVYPEGAICWWLPEEKTP